MKTNIFTKNDQTTNTYVIAEAGLNHNGSVEIAKQLIDLAVEAGGNCTLSKINEIVVHNNVKILGYANVPGRVAKDASALYAKNIYCQWQHLTCLPHSA